MLSGLRNVSKYLSPKSISTMLIGGILVGLCVGITGFALSQTLRSSLRQDYTASTKAVITQQQLLDHIAAQTVPLILDVRTSAEYASGHIPGAVNIPIQELSQRLDELAEYDLQDPIVVYCERGVRANRSHDILQAAGFVTIQHLEGDMKAWRKYGRPLEHPALDSNRQVNGTHKALEAVVPVSFESQWIVSSEQAISLIQQGAVLLDAQGKGFGLKRFPGATIVSWQQFSQTQPPHRGRLLDDDEQLTQRLQDVGISGDRPVVVFANPPQGWGEDGRIVWMLRTLGHSQVVMVDGGINALLAAQSQLPERVMADPRTRGDFVVQRENSQSTRGLLDWAIQKDELQSLLDQPVSDSTRSALPTRSSPNASLPVITELALDESLDQSTQPILIDTREPREYAGETPYGEDRGGHLPGAIHLYFKDLLTEDGYLFPEPDLRAKLQAYGITPERRAIAYCTGGIRSGWLTTVLAHYGYPVENYAGSMWEWSAGNTDDYPLTR